MRHDRLWLACASALCLIACQPGGEVPGPTGKLASKPVDAQGGTVATDHGVQIAIPPNALFEQVEIVITGLGEIEPPAGTTAIGGGYLFEPENVYFSVPVKVTLPVAGPYPADARLMVARQHGDVWELLNGERTDTRITVETHSFSRWVAVLVDQNAGDQFRSGEHVNWTRLFGAQPSDEVTALTVAADDSIIVAGLTHGAFDGFSQGGNGDAFLRKYDDAGHVVWTQQFGFGSTEHARAVTTDAAGTIYVAGTALHLLEEEGENVNYSRAGGAFVRAYGSGGELQWSFQLKRVGVTSEIDAIAVAGEHLVVVGSEDSSDMFVRMIDKQGNVLWGEVLDAQEGERANSYDSGCAVAVDGQGNVLALGQMNGALAGHSSQSGAVLRKYDPSGTVLWTRVFELDTCADAGSILVSGEVVYVVTHSGVRQLNEAGQVQWEKLVDRRSFTVGALNTAGDLIVAGYTENVPPAEGESLDIVVRKFSAQGEEQWTRQVGSPVTDDVHALAVDSSDRIYLGGRCLDLSGSLTGLTEKEGYGSFLMQLMP